VRNGFFTPPAPPRTSCDLAAIHISSGDPEQIAFSRTLVQNFRSRYSDRAGLVLINVAPIPECDQNLTAYTAELNGITSNELLPLPIGDFNNCCHYTALGAEIVSSLIASELNTAANLTPAIDDRTLPARQVAVVHRVRLRR
jgi:hypothetical protein